MVRGLIALGIMAWAMTDVVWTKAAPRSKDHDVRALLLAKLEEPVTFHFEDTSFQDVLDAVRMANARPGDYGIPIDVNVDGLQQIGLTWKSLISRSIEKVSLKKALLELLEPLGLVYEVQGARLLIFAREHRGRWTLLDREPENKKIRARLNACVDLHFEKARLEDVLKFMRKAGARAEDQDLPIHVDPVGLEEAGVTIRSLVSIHVEKQPLKTALESLLKGLGLTYQVKDGLLTITSNLEEGSADDTGRAP